MPVHYQCDIQLSKPLVSDVNSLLLDVILVVVIQLDALILFFFHLIVITDFILARWAVQYHLVGNLESSCHIT
jgi:hypothetical protein